MTETAQDIIALVRQVHALRGSPPDKVEQIVEAVSIMKGEPLEFTAQVLRRQLERLEGDQRRQALEQ
jgi:hypothetical protein